MEFEYYRPLTAGDRCHLIRAQVGVADKPSRFGGRTAHVTHDFLYANGHGQILTVQRGTWINAERHSSRDRSGDKQPVTFDPYTDDQIAEIDAAYDAETRRGPQTRYFEDVEVGEEIQPRVKGPLVVTDLVVWHLGWGMQLTPPGAFGIARKIRRKAPGLYPPNARNIPDTVQRLHWDPARAQELGIPMSYDYGAMRETWLTHALTDWMGDDGWLLRLRCQHRKFNYIGDTTWVRGKVVDKVQADGRNEVHLEVGCWNQRGEQTTPGSAVVLLPTRERAVELPAPPADSLEELLAVEIAAPRVNLVNRTRSWSPRGFRADGGTGRAARSVPRHARRELPPHRWCGRWRPLAGTWTTSCGSAARSWAGPVWPSPRSTTARARG